jgi:hypothetical protein
MHTKRGRGKHGLEVRMMKMKVFLYIVIGAIILDGLVLAEMYKWVEEHGGVHYSDVPPPQDEPSSEVESLPTPSTQAKPAHEKDSKKKNDVGKPFSDINELFDHYEGKGFIVLGRFGAAQWPAKIMYEKEAMNDIAFHLKKGGTQSYPGYTGYQLKVVSLEDTDGEERVVVFRSKNKVASR